MQIPDGVSFLTFNSMKLLWKYSPLASSPSHGNPCRAFRHQHCHGCICVSYAMHVQAALAQVGLKREKRERLQILEGISGVLQPGRMTLLLGPPSSGKSTLLKGLAGLLTPDRNLKVLTSLISLLELCTHKHSSHMNRGPCSPSSHI